MSLSCPNLELKRQYSNDIIIGILLVNLKKNWLAFGHNPETNLFIIDAHDPEDQSEEPTVRIWISREIMSEFAKNGLEIVSAGRPICQLCNIPIDPSGHYCERRNGHSTHVDTLI